MQPDAADLAPGDAWARRLDWADVALHRVRSTDDARFATGYGELWKQFGDAGEMERRKVIESRLAWDPARPHDGFALLYEMLVLERAGETIAVRDHTAIISLDQPDAPVVVHLSHALVLPRERGTGVGAWLRALPLGTARACAAACGATSRPVILVAEMEPPEPEHEERLARLRIYGRAGFRCVDPVRVDYCQPDFRSPEAIDADHVVPLPLALQVRRVGAEDEEVIRGAEVRAIVRALYTMYGMHQRAADMAPLWRRAEELPGEGEEVRLLSFAP